MNIMVGKLATFWTHRLKKWPETVSKAETWTQAVAATRRMFQSVADPGLDALAAEHGTEVIWDRCFLSVKEVIVANGAIVDMYRYLAEPGRQAPVFEQLLSLRNAQRFDSDVIDEDVERLRQTALASCGSMSDEHPLTASQRRAVHAFLLDLGDPTSTVTAVSGPPGTGKTTMLQSVVASMIVRHALEGRPPPLIVGTSTNNQAVTNIISSFGSVAKETPGPLDHRWLPLIAEDGAAEQPLSGLATYCPAQSKLREARENGFLVEDTRKAGLYTTYSDRDYVTAATAFFLGRLTAYAESTGGMVAPATSIDGAITILRGVLTRVDGSRRILIAEKVAAERAAAAKRSTELAGAIREYERELQICRARLEFWTPLRSAAAARGHRQADHDAFVIAHNGDPAEPARRVGCVQTLDAYVMFYSRYVEEWSAKIAELSAARENALDVEAAAMAPTPAVLEAIRWLEMFGVVDDAVGPRLAEARDLLELDGLLDVTARYAEFWLAVHLYEARWLKEVSGEEVIKKNDRWQTSREVMDRYWRQAPALTPCFVMTAYQLPKYFRLHTRDGSLDFDLGRVDLLIVDEAGQVDTSVGSAAFALAKRALVVGDVLQLAPIWSIDPVSDQEIASLHGLSGNWPVMRERGLTSSDRSSVMASASYAGRWSYGPDRSPGLFLSEHFRCHSAIIEYCNDLLYGGMLVPSRPLQGYKLEGRTPSPFLFHMVPGSVDRSSGSSRVNEREADVVVRWITDNGEFFEDIYNTDGTSPEVIGVVTPFAAQARVIERKIWQLGGPDLAKRITIGTAHRLQGAERPVVLFSSVYGDNTQKASFVDNTLELMNVAVSRAKDLFIVFGGDARWNDDGPVFSLVREHATLDGCRFSDLADEEAHTLEDDPREYEPVAPEATGILVSENPSVSWVSRAEPGYLIGTGLTDRWNDDGLLMNGKKPSAQSLNAVLERLGLIERGAHGTVPTLAGATLGIAAYEGESRGDRFVSVIYSPAAQSALTVMVKDGLLDD